MGNKIIDLRSDTVTKPTKGMLNAMFSASVGDDVFSEDPTVKELERKTAAMFSMEAGLFCPSGTMTNQIAIKVHTNPGDEVICDATAHVYNYEGGGIAMNSGASVRVVHGDRGRFSPEDVLCNINPGNDHFPRTRLVCVENTSNRGGGSFYTLEQMMAISKACKQNGLSIHLDGARIFNAITETGDKPASIGKLFDSVSVCLSKGLGAPAGSVLLGDKDFIYNSRRARKAMGGGMRQAGYLAAAGIYALDNHIDRLKEDHRRAKELGKILSGVSFIKELLPVDTNIVIFKLSDSITNDDFIKKLEKQRIKVVSIGPRSIRMVTHLDFDDYMLEETVKCLKN